MNFYLKTVLSEAVQFSWSKQFKCQNSSISSNSVYHTYIVYFYWPIDRILSGANIPGHSGPGSEGCEGVLRIPQNSIITGTSLSDYLVSYRRQSLGDITPLQGRCRCILQIQQTGQLFCWDAVGVFYSISQWIDFLIVPLHTTGTVITLPKEKWRTHKTLSCFTNRKFISYYTF